MSLPRPPEMRGFYTKRLKINMAISAVVAVGAAATWHYLVVIRKRRAHEEFWRYVIKLCHRNYLCALTPYLSVLQLVQSTTLNSSPSYKFMSTGSGRHSEGPHEIRLICAQNCSSRLPIVLLSPFQ